MNEQEHLSAIKARCEALLMENQTNLTEAEAGWKATIAAIDLAFYSMGFIPAHQITFKPMIDAIRAAWPVELLQN